MGNRLIADVLWWSARSLSRLVWHFAWASGGVLCSVSIANAAPFALPAPAVSMFPLSEVRLTDGPFKRAEELNRAYLLSIDPDRLLYHFRVNAGIPTTARPYGGWEASDWDFHGHILGHYLTACAQMAAHGGEPEVRRRVDYIVAALAECQAAWAKTASHPGFLDPQPESVFARLEQGDGSVPVPYYTMHKTLAGLLDAYTLAHNAQALAVAEGLADWLKFRLDRLTDDQVQAALRIEPGGLNEALANLYAITGNPEHLRLALRLNHRAFFEPFARGEDRLGPGPGNGRLIHANTQVPKAIGAAREYELTGTTTFRDVAVNFWRDVAETRSFIIGGNSEQEHFFACGTESQHLTPRTAEFCNTYNMLKLTRHLFTWAPSAELMDFYERALYNHVLAAQDADTGLNTYFMSLEPGGRKRFATPDNTFWCCTGTGMEMNTKVADAIYAHDDRALYVNLFIASELDWVERALSVRQLTDFPTSDRTTLVIRTAHPQRLAIKVRYPGWAGELSVAVNDEPVAVSQRAGSYFTVEREWRDNDRVNIALPMRVRVVPLADESSLVAFQYGPVVLAGDLGDEGLRFKPRAFVDNGKDPKGPRAPEPPAFVPGLVGNSTDLPNRLQRIPGTLTFRTVGVARPHDVTLVPLYQITEDAYTVYWRVYDEPEWRAYWSTAEAKEADREARQKKIVDAVWAGLPPSEAAHSVSEAGAPVVSSRLSLYRDATEGFVAWKLQAVENAPMNLRVGFLGGDAAAFDLLIDGRPLAAIRPRTPAPATPNRATVTTIRTYSVPAEWVHRPLIELRVVGHADLGPARIVFCEVARP